MSETSLDTVSWIWVPIQQT